MAKSVAKITIDATDAIKTLKAIQREAREATKALRELEAKGKRKTDSQKSVFATEAFEVIQNDDGFYSLKAHKFTAFSGVSHIISAFESYLNDFYNFLTADGTHEPVRINEQSVEFYMVKSNGAYYIKFGEFKSSEIWDMYFYLKDVLEQLKNERKRFESISKEMKESKLKNMELKILDNGSYCYEEKQTATPFSDECGDDKKANGEVK